VLDDAIGTELVRRGAPVLDVEVTTRILPRRCADASRIEMRQEVKHASNATRLIRPQQLEKGARRPRDHHRMAVENEVLRRHSGRQILALYVRYLDRHAA